MHINYFISTLELINDLCLFRENIFKYFLDFILDFISHVLNIYFDVSEILIREIFLFFSRKLL